MQTLFTGIVAAARRAAPRPATPGSTVLLCDWNDDLHAIYGAFLEHHGFTVVHARSVHACLRLVGARHVSAVVVTVGSRGLFRWRAYRALAQVVRSTRPALVCLTTDPRLARGARRPRRCADTVLMLPCAPEILVAEVARVIDKARRPAN